MCWIKCSSKVVDLFTVSGGGCSLVVDLFTFLSICNSYETNYTLMKDDCLCALMIYYSSLSEKVLHSASSVSFHCESS